MRAWGLTDRGVVREQNQDACLFEVSTDQERAVCVVCDGMGGAKGGNVASELAARIFLQQVYAFLKAPMPEKQLADLARRAVAAANAAVHQEALEDPDCEGMGTTLVAALVFGKKVLVVNVGDSRAYHICESGIRQITRDHSLVEVLVKRGELTPQEAAHHPSKNLITRALGPEQQVKCDLFSEDLKAGEILLLCSDGLSNTVGEQEMLYEAIHGEKVASCARRLLEISLSRGAPDNVTAVVLEK